jgi:hypothetical protein
MRFEARSAATWKPTRVGAPNKVAQTSFRAATCLITAPATHLSCAETRVGIGHGMRLPVPGNAYAVMASAIASATRTARSLSRGSTRWRVTREARELGRARRSCSPRKQASGLVRPSLFARSCLRPEAAMSHVEPTWLLCEALRARSSSVSALSPWTNLSSTPGAAGETPASPGDPVEQLALVALELDFCVLEQAGTRATLNETDEMDGGCFSNASGLARRVRWWVRGW